MLVNILVFVTNRLSRYLKKKVVKPMDRLVLVSSTHYCAYTPNLSNM
jgi:hypothetical protein